jgi:hypothetical protein
MSNYRRLTRRPERRGRGCLIFLVVLIWVILGGVLFFQYYLRPRISQEIGQQISRQLVVVPTAQPGQPAGPTSVVGTIQSAGILPTLVASLPAGEITITEAAANDYMATNIERFKPIESIKLHFVPGVIEAELVALRSTSTARMGAAIQDGQIIATNPNIDGPLANLVNLQDLVGPLQQQLNDELRTQNRHVTDVRVEQGVLVFVVE